MGRWWYVVIAFRLLAGVSIHYGYIHPDEYFQSIEVAAGDIFDLKVYRPWEFDSVRPIRSIVPVYLMSGIPLSLLKLASHVVTLRAEGATLLRAVRLWMLFLTFFVDWNVYKTLKSILKKDDKDKVMIFAKVLMSSAIILVFGSRTFSNTLEMILFAWLIRLTIGEEYSFRENIPTLALILVTGIFTRPTFIIFALIPLCQSIFACSKFNVKIFFKNIFEFALFCSVLMLIFIFIDSVYFNSSSIPYFANLMLHLSSQQIYETVYSNLKITPLNFVAYNLKSDNLAQHGLHSRVTHFLFNAPSLFLGLTFLAYFDVLSRIFKFKINLTGHLSGEKSLTLLLTCLFSISVLSLFPHQEARFLLPLITPLIILYSPCMAKHKVLFVIGWVVPNLVLAHFLGLIHQAGLVPAILAAKKNLITPGNNKNVTAVFWKSYMPPRSLFGVSEHQAFSVVDLAGAPEKDFRSSLGEILGTKKSRQCQVGSSEKNYVYLFVPGSVIRGSECLVEKYRLKLLTLLWPHFSGEHPPFFNEYILNCSRPLDWSKECPFSDDRLCGLVPERLWGLADSMSYKIFSVLLDC